MRLRFWGEDPPLPPPVPTGFPIDPAIQAAPLTAIQEEVVAAMNHADCIEASARFRHPGFLGTKLKQPKRGPRIIADRPAYIHSMSIDAMLAGMKGDLAQARRLHERLATLCAGAKKPRLQSSAQSETP